MDAVKNFASKKAKLSVTSMRSFLYLFTCKKFKKGDILYKKCDSSRKFFLLESGITRSYLIDKNGAEKTRSLFMAPSIFTSLVSSLYEEPSEAEFNCLTDCKVYEGDFKKFLDLTKKHHDIAILYNRILEESFINMEEKATILSILNATDRYLYLKNKYPDIDDLIQQNHIASYLSITPIQLSRIRRKIFSSKKK